jgi:hypothetical protein
MDTIRITFLTSVWPTFGMQTPAGWIAIMGSEVAELGMADDPPDRIKGRLAGRDVGRLIGTLRAPARTTRHRGLERQAHPTLNFPCGGGEDCHDRPARCRSGIHARPVAQTIWVSAGAGSALRKGYGENASSDPGGVSDLPFGADAR